MAKINERVNSLSEKLVKGIDFDKKTGVGTADNTVYAGNLPEGVNMEQVNAISEYDADFVAAGQKAIGELGIKAMTSDKKLDVVSAVIKMSDHKEMSTVFSRSKEYNAGPGSDEKIVKFGVPTTKFTISANNDGQIKGVKDFLNEAAKAALA
jgi:hypothetical protein